MSIGFLYSLTLHSEEYFRFLEDCYRTWTSIEWRRRRHHKW